MNFCAADVQGHAGPAVLIPAFACRLRSSTLMLWLHQLGGWGAGWAVLLWGRCWVAALSTQVHVTGDTYSWNSKQCKDIVVTCGSWYGALSWWHKCRYAAVFLFQRHASQPLKQHFCHISPRCTPPCSVPLMLKLSHLPAE